MIVDGYCRYKTVKRGGKHLRYSDIGSIFTEFHFLAVKRCVNKSVRTQICFKTQRLKLFYVLHLQDKERTASNHATQQASQFAVSVPFYLNNTFEQKI